MLEWIKNIFRKNTANINSGIDGKTIADRTKFIWCLIGNVIDKHSSKTDPEIKRGTKHFSPNTKVYCFPVQWGDGYTNIKVIGKHRKTSRTVCIVMPAKFIINWRLQKVYSPHIIRVMQSQNGWTSNDKDKNAILKMLTWLPDRTTEMDQ